MRYTFPFLFSIIVLAACSKAAEDTPKEEAPTLASSETIAANIPVSLDGQITLTAEPLLSEDAACVMPLRVSNGTKAEISVSMFGFSVTGPGDDDTGNMFPQVVPSGEYQTARIIQIGQSCSAFDTITLKDVLCKTDGQDCEVIFEDSPEITFKTASK